MTTREKVLLVTNLVLLLFLILTIGNRLPEKAMVAIAWGMIVSGTIIPLSLLIAGILRGRNPPPFILVASQWAPRDRGATITHSPSLYVRAPLEEPGAPSENA